MSIVTVPEDCATLAHELGNRGMKIGEAQGATVALWPPGATPSPSWVDAVVKQQIPVIHNEGTRLPEACNGYITPIDFADIPAMFRAVERAVRQTVKDNASARKAPVLPEVPEPANFIDTAAREMVDAVEPPPLDIPNLPDAPTAPTETSNVEPADPGTRFCAHCGMALKEHQAKFCNRKCSGASRRKKK